MKLKRTDQRVVKGTTFQSPVSRGYLDTALSQSSSGGMKMRVTPQATYKTKTETVHNTATVGRKSKAVRVGKGAKR